MKESLANNAGIVQRLREGLSAADGAVIRQQLQEQRKRAFANVRKAQSAGVKIAVGTGAGDLLIFPGASVHRELQLLVKAGLTPMEAIVAATRNTADSLGRGNELGTIEPGKEADLLILDADPLLDIQNTQKIHAIVLRGREVHSQELQLR
jgi:imidazolonepropionase-like amidohydrolase